MPVPAHSRPSVAFETSSPGKAGDLAKLAMLHAEAEETAVVWGMPGELVKANGADFIVPLPDIADQLQKLMPPCR